MNTPFAMLLEKTRLPQPSFQRLAVVSIFRSLDSSTKPLNRDSNALLDAISQCLHSSSSVVVDQSVHELCSIIASGDRLPTSFALIELQSALEGCESRFAPVFVKGIGFICRHAFSIDSSWGRFFDRVELHPFVKILSCREEAHEELIEQALLFIIHNKWLGINEVVRFLRPFIMFSMISKPSSRSFLFSRNLISAISSLSCSLPLEAIDILKLLSECLSYLPLSNEEEFTYIVSSAVHIVDAYIVVLQNNVNIDEDLTKEAQRCSIEVLSMLLWTCAFFHRKPMGQVGAVIELSRHLLMAQKEYKLGYTSEFVKIFVSISVIITQVEFEHDQLLVLKLIILLIEWKTEELSCRRTSCSLNEELLIVFPIIGLLSSPSNAIKAAASHLLSLAEPFILNFMGALERDEVPFNGLSVLNELESIPLRLLYYLFIKGQGMLYFSYFFLLSCDKTYCAKGKGYGLTSTATWLREQFLLSERAKATLHPQLSENQFEGLSTFLSSIAASLVIYPGFSTSAVDALVALSLQNPKLGMSMLQTVLFFINILSKLERNSSRILLSLLEMLPSLASHPAMVQVIVQTLLPMLHEDAKQSLQAVAIRLICKTWVVSDRVFEHLQDALSLKSLSNCKFSREVCISIAASVRDVCKHNPNRGVDLILSVSSSIESADCTVKALGLESLSLLCEADVVDFYSAWDVIEKHVKNYAEEPIVAAGLVTLLRWGALDAEAYPDIALNVLLILCQIGTLRSYSLGSSWVKARSLAFKSMMHYEIMKFQEIIPEFKETILQCLLNECHAEVLEAMEEFEIKFINFEHINRRRALKEKRPLSYKIEKLLDMFPKVLFSPGTESPNLNAREFPGASLLTYAFTPKEWQGVTNAVPRIHAAFEKALVEAAESLPLSRNLLMALLSLDSLKSFIRQWMKTLATSIDVKGSPIKLESDGLKNATDILKICCKIAVETVPQVSMNAALAIGALCLVVPSSSHAIISSSADFLLKWLVDYEHEHRQWSSAISLGLISNCFHATDRTKKNDVITLLIKVASNSKSHLVAGACGLGLGFTAQSLLSNIEIDSIKITDEILLLDVIKTLITVLIKLCPHASSSLNPLIEIFLANGHNWVVDSFPACQRKLNQFEDDEEDDPWGLAGLVLGLGYCVVPMYRLGMNDAALIVKDVLLSWLQSINEMTDMPLAAGACLAIPCIFVFFQRVELSFGGIDAILILYASIVSCLLNSKERGVCHQSLLMGSCVGAGSFLSCVLGNGAHDIEYKDVKHLIDVLRTCYSESCSPFSQLGGMVGVANALGAAVGELSSKHLEPCDMPIALDLKGSISVRGPIILSPVCENLSTSLIQELIMVAKEAKGQQLKSYAAWSLLFLRRKWRSEKLLETRFSENTSVASNLQSQALAEDSLVWKMSLWLSNIDYNKVHSTTVVAVLRCVSKAPRLPIFDWSSIIRNLMKNATNFTNSSHILNDSASFREECVKFSLARAKNIQSLAYFLDDLVDISRFRTLEQNLQCLILRSVSSLMSAFSASRMERLFRDFALFFSSSSSSSYLAYGPEQRGFLRISFWKGLYDSINETCLESSYVCVVERCMECVFFLLPVYENVVKSEVLVSARSEWFEAIRCLSKARRSWLIDAFQLSSSSTLNEIAIKIIAQLRLVRDGSSSFSELEKLKTFILNFKLEGLWWSVLAELIATLSIAEVSIKRQWLLDALDVSCVAENPLTAISFIGLLSGSCSKYMPLLIADPENVLRDLPLTLPSLISSARWTPIAESFVEKLLISTERICASTTMPLAITSENGRTSSIYVEKSDVRLLLIIARSMHRTCLSLKEYLPVDRRMRLANIAVPQHDSFTC